MGFAILGVKLEGHQSITVTAIIIIILVNLFPEDKFGFSLLRYIHALGLLLRSQFFRCRLLCFSQWKWWLCIWKSRLRGAGRLLFFSFFGFGGRWLVAFGLFVGNQRKSKNSPIYPKDIWSRPLIFKGNRSCKRVLWVRLIWYNMISSTYIYVFGPLHSHSIFFAGQEPQFLTPCYYPDAHAHAHALDHIDQHGTIVHGF